MGLTHSNEFYGGLMGFHGGLMGFYGGLMGILELTSCFQLAKNVFTEINNGDSLFTRQKCCPKFYRRGAKNAWVIGRDSFQVSDRKTYGKAA
jgi:hypothetical protein